MSYATQDRLLRQTKALSNGAGNTAIDGFDLGHTTTNGGRFLSPVELVIEMPALTTTELPDTETYIMSLEESVDAAFTSPVIRYTNVGVQLGAGGAGAAAKTYRLKIPTDSLRFVRVKGTKTGTGNVSGKSMTVTMRF